MILGRVGAAILAMAALASLPTAIAQTPGQRSRAVEQTLSSMPACHDLGDLYWEIGDASGVLARGQRGTAVTADGILRIASASKWVFGAYVIERTGGALTEAQIAQLEMRSGYDGLNPLSCGLARTVAGCFERRRNDHWTAAHSGRFSYNGGHDQKLAVDLGLGALDADGFAAEIRRVLGPDLTIAFGSPQPAGGMRASPAAYGAFLRKILTGRLRISAYLGADPVCTLPAACPQAVHSPAPFAWHYSLNHWIEDAPGGDGAFSSPGLFGFYPWISADKRLYGILARETWAPGAWIDSARCGALLRRAWSAGAVPPAPS